MNGTYAGPAVSVRNVAKRYPIVKGYRDLVLHPFRRKTLTALEDISLEVAQGRCFCLLGPNGAGKTTLIKILTTLILPDEGEAKVCGLDIVREPALVRESVGLAVAEERSFYWRLSGRENLRFFAALQNLPGPERDDRVAEVLRLTGLSAAADRRFDSYSTGMRQMLAFARALLTDARVLFVDEPTRSLDPRAAGRIREFLRRDLVDGRGRTVFWATHNLAEAKEVAHELGVIAGGRVRALGTVDALTDGGGRDLRSVYESAVGEEPERDSEPREGSGDGQA